MSDILTGTASDLAQLDARMQILARNRTNDGVLAIDKDAEDAVKIETPIAGVSDIVRQSLEILAAMNRNPAVKLLGISPSGFNATGESDIRNYYDHIGSQQEKVIRNPLKAVLDVAQVSLWGEADAGLTFDFCPLSVVDDASAAITQQTKINTLCALIDRNVISVEEARQVLTDDTESGFDELDPDAVPDAGGMEDAGGAEPPALGERQKEEENPRPFDVALDGVGDEEWRTNKKGKRYEIDTETGEITKGYIGQESGEAVERQKKIQEKIDSVRIIPDRDNVLPNLNKETLQELGKPDKPVLLKKNIIKRNAFRHGDVDIKDAPRLIGEALYNHTYVKPGNNEKDYFNFIKVDKKRNYVVLLDVQDARDNFEIVHWHYIDIKGVGKLLRKAGRIESQNGMEGQA